ncbi:MAG: hypothetical protein QG567_1933 [Campylobacterota bacterium]|nr:hypothetical protein [Campylobacterota bacterium]
MRIYTKEQLHGLSKQALQLKLDMVNASIALTREEVIANREVLTLALNNGVRFSIPDVLEDIKAGSADIDDIMI